ncbi:hypothetical protein I7I50_00038 [Histoplasma capsulatum G186AR]|uniref:Uncharacterized protein n=1 Tax=Ajellomyces capsulatus TaxID=5037 RepID=A0A8H7YF49_AJECA|nr:hypothetical protein I7I52_07307 [Histoplasma capsulatum]QSS72244.1 hypothetical protein I7I50_00038 [Histoplasma capsulatum G186AR]
MSLARRQRKRENKKKKKNRTKKNTPRSKFVFFFSILNSFIHKELFPHWLTIPSSGREDTISVFFSVYISVLHI